MPTYDYRCNACGHTFEEFQMMSDRVRRKCPECGKLKLERLIGSGAGFVFKGSGYYVTDYRSKSYDDAKKADTAEKKSSESGGSSPKSDSSSKSGSSSKKKSKPSGD